MRLVSPSLVAAFAFPMVACAATASLPAAVSATAPRPIAVRTEAAAPPVDQDQELADARARLQQAHEDALSSAVATPEPVASRSLAKAAPASPPRAPLPVPEPVDVEPPPPPAITPPPAPVVDVSVTCEPDFAGAYTTNWGDATVTQHGCEVDVVYDGSARGAMRCVARGSTLGCAWRETFGSGKAAFARESDGSWTGTWGGAANATEGGEWTFRRAGSTS
jgi:hypothetical protein